MSLIDRAKAIWSLFTGGGMTKTDKLILVAALLYCLSPVDIIPDVVPIVGLLDDLLVVLLTLRRFSNSAPADPTTVHVEPSAV
ncbi:MAG: DUF1232 domain-containing protein [Planctomycetes bacterium]|nr:DUF1232 domain-containing protein [Planctomycetota bacterium]